MDRQNETVELFEAFEVEQLGGQVREGGPYCYWCYYIGPDA